MPLNRFASSLALAVRRPASRRTFPRTWRRLCRESTTLEHRHRNRSCDHSLCDCPAIFREPPALLWSPAPAARCGAALHFNPSSISRMSRSSFPLPPSLVRFIRSAVVTGGRGRIRTSVARKERQIYSLLVLATHPPVPEKSLPLIFLNYLCRNILALAATLTSGKHKTDSCQKTPARLFSY